MVLPSTTSPSTIYIVSSARHSILPPGTKQKLAQPPFLPPFTSSNNLLSGQLERVHPIEHAYIFPISSPLVPAVNHGLQH